jgi:protein TonB
MALAIVLLVGIVSYRLGYITDAVDALHTALHGGETNTIQLREFPEGRALPPPPPPVTALTSSDEVFVVTETPPVLMGGLSGLQQQISYPVIARRAGIEGRVFLQFIVEKDGTPSNIAVIRGIGAGCDEEAVRALEHARFRPGKQRGRPVRVKMSLPVNFRLH